MNDLLMIALHNTLVVLVLAVGLYALMRVWCNPPLAHLLWLLLLLKLVCPPLIEIEGLTLWPPTSTEGEGVAGEAPFEFGELRSIDAGSAVDSPARQLVPAASTSVSVQRISGASVHRDVAYIHWAWMAAPPMLCLIWMAGAAIAALVTLSRALRFDRRLRGALPASSRLQQTTAQIADRLGIRRVPEVRQVQSASVPFLWCFGRRATIVLPVRLTRCLDDGQLAMILAHELAHLRRRDHWVRGIETIISTIYWWNPLVKVIRRELHQAEDLCCDAWVRCSYPQGASDYAELLVWVAESLGTQRADAPLVAASPFLRFLSLKARIEMILHRRFSPQLSIASLVIAMLIAGLVLPLFVQTATRVEAGDRASEAAIEPADFPHIVHFEQGATRFLPGDKITIREVRGTAATFEPDNIYCITGRYRLASHDQVMLAAYTTAKRAADGVGPSSKTQTVLIDRGEGTFKLFLPMSCEGWPHISFYAGGEGIGGNYFGTGDSVLKKWWGSTDDEDDDAVASESEQTGSKAAFPHKVSFEQGATKFKPGDDITILEVRGTAPTFLPGNIYWIRGKYQLASRDRAKLAAFTTATKAGEGRGSYLKVQSIDVERGEGSFTLYLPMSYEGLPHVSFYGDGEGFGGSYFGTGDSVLRDWWGS